MFCENKNSSKRILSCSISKKFRIFKFKINIIDYHLIQKRFLTLSKIDRKESRNSNFNLDYHFLKSSNIAPRKIEKFTNEEKLSKEKFYELVQKFQIGNISLENFPVNCKQFIRLFYLLPKLPDDPDDCCMRDCTPCKIDFYYEMLERRDEMIEDLYKKIYFDDKNENNKINEDRNGKTKI